MSLELTGSIASSGIYKKNELMSNFQNDKVGYRWENKTGKLNIRNADGGNGITVISVGIVWWRTLLLKLDI
jgi:hypothetical protein